MSLSSTSTAPGRRPARVVGAAAVAVAVLAPLAVLFAQVWSSTGSSRSFIAYERRGVGYLEPLTALLGATTEAQSAAVRGRPVDVDAVNSAVAGVDRMDAQLGAALNTTDRWTTARGTVRERLSRTSWPLPSDAYTQYSDLNTALLELGRTVGDNSRLILDPAIDSYYVMNASLLRIPEILVDSGRYADLSVLAAAGGEPDATSQAQLAAARNRVATDATDLSDGLVKAFAQTGSSTLGPGLTRQLDNFRTAVDAVAPSSSLLAPVPERSVSDLVGDQVVLARATLQLQRAALDQLDLLLSARGSGETRSRIIALVAAGIGVLVAAGLASLAWRWLPPVPVAAPRHAEPEPGAPRAGFRQRSADEGAVPVHSERSGGARAAR